MHTDFNRDLLKAKKTQATQNRINRTGKAYKFRLNALAVTGQRKGKFW